MITVTVFLAGFLVDVAYVGWVRSIGENRKLLAAAASMAIGACGLLGVTGVVTNYWLAIPYLLGLGAGTVAGLLFKPTPEITELVGLRYDNKLGIIVSYRGKAPAVLP
jgi:hypothetical protein